MEPSEGGGVGGGGGGVGFLGSHAPARTLAGATIVTSIPSERESKGRPITLPSFGGARQKKRSNLLPRHGIPENVGNFYRKGGKKRGEMGTMGTSRGNRATGTESSWRLQRNKAYYFLTPRKEKGKKWHIKKRTLRGQLDDNRRPGSPGGSGGLEKHAGGHRYRHEAW